MEEYRDLWPHGGGLPAHAGLPEPPALDAGIVLQAYLPDAARGPGVIGPGPVARHRDGGAASRCVWSRAPTWPWSTWRPSSTAGSPPRSPPSSTSTPTYKRLVARALDPVWGGALHTGLASHNLYDVAWGLLAAAALGSSARLEVEMLEGMAPGQAEAVRRRADARAPVRAGGRPRRVRRRRRLSRSPTGRKQRARQLPPPPGRGPARQGAGRADRRRRADDQHRTATASGPHRRRRAHHPRRAVRQPGGHRLGAGAQSSVGAQRHRHGAVAARRALPGGRPLRWGRPHRAVAGSVAPVGDRPLQLPPGRCRSRRSGRRRRPAQRRPVRRAAGPRARATCLASVPGRVDRRHGRRRRQDRGRGRRRGIRGRGLRRLLRPPGARAARAPRRRPGHSGRSWWRRRGISRWPSRSEGSSPRWPPATP